MLSTDKQDNSGGRVPEYYARKDNDIVYDDYREFKKNFYAKPVRKLGSLRGYVTSKYQNKDYSLKDLFLLLTNKMFYFNYPHQLFKEHYIDVQEDDFFAYLFTHDQRFMSMAKEIEQKYIVSYFYQESDGYDTAVSYLNGLDTLEAGGEIIYDFFKNREDKSFIVKRYSRL